MTIIYALLDPTTELIRYVGKTNGTAARRYNSHIYNWQRSTSRHVDCWIKSLAGQGLKPTMVTLDTVSDHGWEFWEQWWIAQCRAWGFQLCNHAEGGGGTVGIRHSKEVYEARSERNKTSSRMQERNLRHSILIKQKHAEGATNFGYAHLEPEKRAAIGRDHAETMRKKHKANPELRQALRRGRILAVEQLDEMGSVLDRFKSVTAAGKKLFIEPTHITRVCKGKAKSGQTHGYYFRYAQD